MGWLLGFLQNFGLFRKKANVLCIGLDNSGKTTIINGIRPDKIPETDIIPTVGFSVSIFSKDKLSFTVFDMSGQGKYRDLWEHYYPDANAIIFVIDSTDQVRCCVARDELEALMKHPVMAKKKIPILFLANKMDLAKAMTPSDISQAMGLEAIKEQNWYICATNALTGEGVANGMDWLSNALDKSM